MSDEYFDYLFKVVIVGDSAVGKTNILSRFVQDSFTIDTRPTLGVEFDTKTLTTKDKKIVKNQIWDTAGQQRFRAITNAYYRRAQGALIVFDLTRHKTFQNLPMWIEELRQFADKDICISLVGNKNDLQNREVSDQAIQNFINLNKMSYIQTSALTGENIQQVFEDLTQSMYKKARTHQQVNPFPIYEAPKLIEIKAQEKPKQEPKVKESVTLKKPIKKNSGKANKKCC